MAPSVLSSEHQRVLDRFPPLLKALVEAELQAGNRIIDAGAGHPAPPAGDLIKLERDLLTWKDTTGLQLHARHASTHHQEVTDDQRFFWILTAPLPPPPEPDMDAIRTARNHVPPPPPVVRAYPHDTVEMDVRGETLILHEADRRCDIVWTWSRGNILYRSSLSTWWYPAEQRSQAMTDAEKERVLERLMDYARIHIGANTELKD